ncbi:MAG: methionine gamma-lyase family protein [Clostridiales bacterium]|nr:methionine gamma-lyase family protein [Candidatus Equinaster intestinalis]
MSFNFDSKLELLAKNVRNEIKPQFEKIGETTRFNQQKVLSAFAECGVLASHLGSSTGYGYDDSGRDKLEEVFAKCMGAEDSLIRHNFVSGTHTLTVALFGLLRPGDKMLCLTGRPYDTLIGVLGIDRHSDGSLKDFGVIYDEVALKNDAPDIEKIKEKLKNDHYKMAYIQRSRGYTLRPSLTTEKIAELCRAVKEISPDTVIMVDNCYGEFVETKEPVQVGADIMAGSLIKNAGGGIAPTGGYIAGRKDLVEKCAYRLTAPGVGREIGASLGVLRELYMGLFAAPHTVGEALKTAVFAAKLFEKLGFEATPAADEYRADIIEAIKLTNSENLIAFCEGIQSGSPIDSSALPYPSDMPGYDSKIIMAAGTFTLGASIELSADAPIREPYAVWMQGGLNFESGEIGILCAAQNMINKGLVTI